GQRAAYTTVLTHLQRLEAKGYAASDKRGLAHVFRAAVSRDRLLRRRLKSLADELCDGAASPLLHALVEGRRFKPEEIERFRRMLDEREGRAWRACGFARGAEREAASRSGMTPMLWWLAQNTLLAAALAALVAIACRVGRFRPAVRHALWLLVLLKLVAPP